MQTAAPDRKILRKFAVTMGLFFAFLGVICMLRRRPATDALLIVSCLFFICALSPGGFLVPLYRFWMRLALVLSWVNTRLLLCILFYLVLTPIGLVMRLLGKDLLDTRIEKEAATYWKNKEPAASAMGRFEKQF